MRAYSLTHLNDAELLRRTVSIAARSHGITAVLLAHIAEVDVRRLYLACGHASMHAYCVGELGFSDDASFKRIQAARAARRFPVLFEAVAGGRLHLTAVRLLAPHLTAENLDELLAMATHQRSCVIEAWLARRFPSRSAADVSTRIRVLPAAPAAAAGAGPVAAGQVDVPLFPSSMALAAGQADAPSDDPADPPSELAAGQVDTPATPPAPAPAPAPPAEERYLLRLAIAAGTHAKLRYAQALLRHSVPSGDVAAVLDRALDALIEKCEKRKFAATPKGRAAAAARRRRSIPAEVRRGVWARDEGRCTFVGTGGQRCGTRAFLEFDHVDPVARGGRATLEGIRLRCRAHNQLEAERVFGRGFMERKRRESAGSANGAGPGGEAGSGPEDPPSG